MKDRITIEWQISDGYIGCMRPQSFVLNLSDFKSYSTREDIENYINICVQGDFEEKVTYRVTNLDEIIIKIEEYLKSTRKNNGVKLPRKK